MTLTVRSIKSAGVKLVFTMIAVTLGFSIAANLAERGANNSADRGMSLVLLAGEI